MMSLPPDDRSAPEPAHTHRRPAHAAAPVRSSDQTNVPARSESPFTPISLRPAVDVNALQERLQQLGQTRSTAALAERADILRLLGRLDEALSLAEEVFRLTMFTGERADQVAARIRRAHVLHDLGRYERAATEAAVARNTAVTEEWPELEGAAAELEGWSLYELSRFEEARAALSRSYEAFLAAGAPGERTKALKNALETAMRASMSQPSVAPGQPRSRAHDAAARTDDDPGMSQERPRAPEPTSEPERSPRVPRRLVLGAPDAARTDDDTLFGKGDDRR